MSQLKFTKQEWSQLARQYPENGDQVIVHVFNPYGTGDWYLTEYNSEDRTFFGLCDLGYPELGYVAEDELFNLRVKPHNLPLEKDNFWNKRPLKEIQEERRQL